MTFLDKRTTLPPQPTIDPNCQSPRCGSPPYYCPEAQLSQLCLQQRLALETVAPRRLATLSSNTDDDNNGSKEKSTSPGTTVMLVFVGVIALAIIGFLYIRCSRQNTYTPDLDYRKSSTWDV